MIPAATADQCHQEGNQLERSGCSQDTPLAARTPSPAKTLPQRLFTRSLLVTAPCFARQTSCRYSASPRPSACTLAITLDRQPAALPSTRNRLRTAVRRGASWTAAYHRQLTVAAVARPVRDGVGAPASLLLSGPGGCSPGRRLPGGASSRDRALRRRRHGRPGQQARHGVGRRCPAGGVHPSGLGVRDPAVQPSGVRSPGVVVQRVRRSDGCCPPVRCPAVRCPAVRCPSVRCPAVWCLPSSVRTRPSPPMLRRWRWDQGRGGRATVTTGTGGGPGGCRAVDGSIDGPRGGTRATLPTSRWSLGGRWRTRAAGLGAGRGGRACPLSDQAGQTGVRSAPRGWLRGGHGSRRQRQVAAPAAWLASSGWVGDHGEWSSPSLTAGWAAPEGPLEVPAGMGVRPQRGPSRRRARLARCRQRSDLRRWVVGLPGLEPGTSSLSGIVG